MSVSLFSKIDFLDEKPSDVDRLGYDNEVSQVKKRIDRLVKKKKHSIVAYLGPFGVGKSSVLREVKKRSNAYRWITFEMWRYSNRNELWDAFVIKLASELSRGKDEFDIADQIEGSALNRRELISLAIWIFCVWFTLTVFAMVFWFAFKDGIGVGGRFWQAYLKYAAPTIFPALILVGLGRFLQLSFITNKRPLRRVFELENLLASRIKSSNKPLIVVVEDADRSSDDGAVFLETLNHFLGRLSSKERAFIVVAPQSALSFEKQEGSYKGLETALKIYDEKMYFNSTISDASIVKFYNDLGADIAWKDQLTQATQAIVNAHRKFITIRLLKHALREVVHFSEMNSKINPVIALAIILSRYVEVNSAGTIETAEKILSKQQSYGSSGARAFFIAIALGVGQYDEANTAQEFTLNFTAAGDPEYGIEVYGDRSKRWNVNITEVYRNLIS